MKALFGGILSIALTAPFVANACLGSNGFRGGNDGYDMMGYGFGHGGAAFWLLGTITHVVFVVVGILAAIWLWQHIDKK